MDKNSFLAGAVSVALLFGVFFGGSYIGKNTKREGPKTEYVRPIATVIPYQPMLGENPFPQKQESQNQQLTPQYPQVTPQTFYQPTPLSTLTSAGNATEIADIFFQNERYDLAFQEYKKANDLGGIKKCLPKLEEKLYLEEAFEANLILGDRVAAFNVAKKYYEWHNTTVFNNMISRLYQQAPQQAQQPQIVYIQQPQTQQAQPPQTKTEKQTETISLTGLNYGDNAPQFASLDLNGKNIILKEGGNFSHFTLKKISKDGIVLQDNLSKKSHNLSVGGEIEF